ncbi:hypothetical protein [Klenkia brasiliensis]|uniref:Uncharacterized protein n=1 Tax=Klenkia brasiliensis TaxID=333142 RepID=A0A1G7XN17_9ACTN|nr:hypothetical protein [Klenkia brasiliensis]SDG85572.1 hypothetical protein SAMN05660324_3728 [Klenkia brasiliensis]
MSTPRNDGFDDRPEDQRGWTEPTHLGQGGQQPEQPPAQQGGSWEPPGWSLPDAAPDRPAPQPPAQQPPAQQPPAQPVDRQPTQEWEATPPPAQQWDPPAQQQPQPWDARPQQAPPAQQERRGLFGRRPRKPSEIEQAFMPKGGPAGDLASWGAAHGWTPSDGTAPEDGPLAELTRSAPVRPAKSEVPSNVLRGRADGVDLVAFDVVAPYGRGWVPTYAITAAPVLGHVPGFRLTPARFWRHGAGDLLQLPSGDQEFDTRWVLLAAEDSPVLRRLVEDPVVRQLLLGSDGGDELWSAAGFVAAVRPDGQRPLLVEHHARILVAVVGALAAGR